MICALGNDVRVEPRSSPRFVNRSEADWWVKTEAIVTVDNKLYIVGDGRLHHVDSNDLNREVLDAKKRQHGDTQPASRAHQSKP